MAQTYRARPQDGVAWITGASSGIGRATALELARRGFTVAASARRVEELESLSREAPDGHIRAYPCDVTDRAAVYATVETLERDLGPLALAFLNAGTFFPMKGAGFDPDVVMKTFDLNVGGVVNGLGAVIPRMTGRGRGQIAINASIAGYGGLPTSTAYGASKAALINMAAALKFALDEAGVTMQLVSPGFVGTPLTDRNDFPMPFIMPAEKAAKRICDGFERGGFEITFPRRLSWVLKLANILPYGLYFPLVARATASKTGRA
ncbi:oxidoreductase [Alsobacter soli]|uniref:Oxidoreductase n=1 Tax=Alsobacter soli TaxID=2109933 RepID=A0A2T1HVX6_9HYPH|nr:SDR family NAD(P)-dependent oxidoreductase [Alsobacter soli]PSC05826.1 oxidoreductase [Alsobacter soli]